MIAQAFDATTLELRGEALPLEGSRTPIALAQTRFDEKLPQVSPDGQWIAYESNESDVLRSTRSRFRGPENACASPPPAAPRCGGAKTARNCYVGLDEQLMTVPLRVTVDGKTLEPGVAAPLFVTRIPGGAVQQGGLR